MATGPEQQPLGWQEFVQSADSLVQVSARVDTSPWTSVQIGAVSRDHYYWWFVCVCMTVCMYECISVCVYIYIYVWDCKQRISPLDASECVSLVCSTGQNRFRSLDSDRLDECFALSVCLSVCFAGSSLSLSPPNSSWGTSFALYHHHHHHLMYLHTHAFTSFSSSVVAYLGELNRG